MRAADGVGTEPLTADEYYCAVRQQQRDAKQEPTADTSAAHEAYTARFTTNSLTEADKALHAVHTQLLAFFRQLQIRARDGDLPAENHSSSSN